MLLWLWRARVNSDGGQMRGVLVEKFEQWRMLKSDEGLATEIDMHIDRQFDHEMDGTAVPEPDVLTGADLADALAKGWADFKLRRGDILMLPVIYVVVGIVASALAFNAALFPIIFPLAAGFALVGPIAAAGFYELSRRHEAGLDLSWRHFLDPLKGRSRGPLFRLSVMLVLVFLGWLAAAQAIFRTTLGTLGAATPELFLGNLFGAPKRLA